MAFKKYIKRGSKVYGPYIYESRRQGNKVVTIYKGIAPPEKPEKPEKKFPKTLLISLFFLLFVLIFFALYFQFPQFFQPTGKITLQISPVSTEGETISGTLKLNLKQYEIVPEETIISIKLGDEETQFKLSDFLTEDKEKIEINFDSLGIESEQGVLTVSLIYNNTTIMEENADIVVEKQKEKEKSEEEPKTPQLPILDNITEENITIEENITEIPTPMPEDIIETNVTLTENITIPEINVTNVTEINITELNVTNITETNVTNITIETLQYQAVIGKPVKWKKTIKPEMPTDEDITITLPPTSTNITLKKIQEEQVTETASLTGQAIRTTGKVSMELEIERESLFSKIINFFKKLFRRLTGRAVEDEKVDEEQEVEVTIQAEQDVEEYEIEYLTEAPEAIEAEVASGKKQITITAPDYLHYTDILAYTFLQKEVSTENAIKLYWLVNDIDNTKQEINFTSYDINENGFIDYIEWLVPSLSNQTYEISITILTVQSYPTLYGNWTVIFNTTGIADLTIKASNGTNWSNSNEDNDLKFLEVRCGSQILDYEWIDDILENSSIFIANYSCNETGYEISKVLTPGKHTIMFQFGDEIAYAYNLVEIGPVNLWNYTSNPSSGNDEAYGIAIDSSNNIIIAGYDNSLGGSNDQWRVEKLNSSGSNLWNYTSNPSNFTDLAYNTASDSQNSILIAGYDNSPGGNDTRIRVEKLNSSGSNLWNYTSNPNPNQSVGLDYSYDIAVDSNDSIVIAGPSIPPTQSVVAIRVEKLNSSGSNLWNYTSNQQSGELINGLAIDSQNSIIIAGSDNRSGNMRIRVEKLNSSGSNLWNYTSNPSSGGDEAYEVAVDSNDNIIIVGYDRSPGNKQWRVEKLNSSGSNIWNYTSNPSSEHEEAFGIATDSSNNIIIAGYDYSQSSEDDQWRVEKINSSGSNIWNYTSNPTPGTYYDWAYDVAIDSQDNIIIAGMDSSLVNWQLRVEKLREQDVVAPRIILNSPADSYSTTSTGITFIYNVSDLNEIANCSLIINNQIVAYNSSYVNNSILNNISYTFSSTGTYTWKINCTDNSSNIGNSSSRNISITSPSTGGGGGVIVIPPCTENWQCTNWSKCLEDQQTRSCTDASACGTTKNKPTETQTCKIILCEENWRCEWTECNENGISYAVNCIDLKACNTTQNKPYSITCYYNETTGNYTQPQIQIGDCITKWNCTEWTNCEAAYTMEEAFQGQVLTQGRQERTCNDLAKCVPQTLEYQTCNFNIPVSMQTVEWCFEKYVEIYDLQQQRLVSRLKQTQIREILKLDIKLIATNLTGYCDYCYNNIKDYDETDVDCGGPNCPTCVEIPFAIDYLDIILKWLRWFLWILLLILCIQLLHISIKKRKEKRKLILELYPIKIKKTIKGFEKEAIKDMRKLYAEYEKEVSAIKEKFFR